MQGELTATWRAANPKAEPPSQLLTKIKTEKQKLIKADKLKNQKPLPPIKEEEEEVRMRFGKDGSGLG